MGDWRILMEALMLLVFGGVWDGVVSSKEEEGACSVGM